MIARKVQLERWTQADGFPSHEVSADLLQKEFRTSDNALSFWRATANSESDPWREPALAIAGGFDRIDALDVAWLPKDELVAESIWLVNTKGKTRIADLVESHLDASNLDGFRLARVARALCRAVRETKNVRRLSRAEVLELLAEAVRSKRVALTNLPKAVRDEVQPRVGIADGA